MEQFCRCCAGLVLLLSFVFVVRGFNVDTVNMVKYRGLADSMFGFSVAEHRESGTSWVLVGAPSAQTRQPGVVRGGAVYRCASTRDNECQEVLFDRSGNNQNSSGYEIDDKSGQWFGATVRSSGDGGVIVACAPRYMYYPVVTQGPRYDPVGTCFVASESFRRFSEYSPCRTSEWGYHRQGHCQAGLGASISKDGTRLFIGAPGSRYWQGQLHSVDATIFMPYYPPEKVLVNAGQLFSENLHDRLNVLSTGEDKASEDDSYLGYSVAVGHFEGSSGSTSVAVGRPRGGQLVGKVLLYTWDLHSLMNITGEQLGAYFGYALCVSDVDGDGLDDVIVGAPMYTHLHNNEENYETGRIYVFYQKGEFQTNHTRDGKNSKSRFGLSLAGLGDINMDGYGDFVVGAPYDSPGERGAIYIYLGSRNGVMEKYSQVISAESIHPALTTFGFSVSGGLDMDNNEYPDLVVGAYESNMAVLLRSRPIVKMAASVVFGTESKQISLEEKNCTLSNGARTICTSVNACLEYTGVGAESRQEFDIQLILDSAKPKNPRLFLMTNEGRSSLNFTQRLTKNSLFCRNFEVFIMPGIRDKLTALEVEMWYSLRNSTQSQVTSSQRRYVRHLMPILDQVTVPMRKDSINIFKKCGDDNVCIPDLRLIVKPSVPKYLLGSDDQFQLDVIVRNHGEDAFEASYSLRVPLGLNYINIERIDENRRDIPVQCSPPSPNTNNTLKCDIGNPLPEHKHVHFKVLMQPFYMEGLHSQYQFYMEVNSTNPEEKGKTLDNIVRLEVPISIDADLEIKGASIPPDVHYNTTSYNKPVITHESDVGPQIVYVYTVRNKGPADVVESKVSFLLPTKTLAGDNLLYLLDQPQTSGPVTCEYVPEANYLKLTLDRKKSMESKKNAMQSGLSKTSDSSSSSVSVSSDGSFHSQRVGSGGRTVEGGRVIENSRGGADSGRTGSESVGYEVEEGGRSGSGSRGEDIERTGNRGGGYGVEEGGRSGSSGGYGVEEGGRSGSSGGRTQGSAYERGEDHLNHRHDYGLYGQIDEGKVLTRDEGFISGGGTFGHGRHDSSEQSRNYKNHSTSSSNARHENRTQGFGAGSGAAGTRVSSSHNYSASWSENGEPTHHFNNYSSYDSDLESEGGRRRVGDSDVARTHHSSSGSGGYNTTRTHHSSSSSSETHSGSSRGSSGQNSGDRIHDSDGSRGVLRHYSTSWSSGSEGNEGQRGSDNVDESRRSEDGQYGYLGNSKVRTHHYSSSSSGDNIDSNQGSGIGQTNVRHYSSSNQNHDNIGVQDRRQYGTSQGENSDIHRYTSSNWGGDNVREHQSSNGGQYGNSQTHTNHYTSTNWDDDSNSDTHRGQHRGSGKDYRQYTSSNWDGDNVDYSRHQGAKAEPSETRHSLVNGGREGTWGSSRHHSSIRGNGDNVDLGYAAVGPQDQLSTSSIQLGGSEESMNGYHSSSSWSSGNERTKDQHYSSSSNVDDDSGRLKLYQRYRREAGEETLQDLLHCNATICTMMTCKIGPLTKGKEVQVVFRSRVWVQTLKKIGAERIVKVSSLLALQMTKLPYIGAPHKPILRSHEVFTDVILTDSPAKPDIVPLWLVVVSAVAGVILLLLLILVLWMLGFFKRNRPSDSAEKEPLNRNGHYSAGDEAL